MVPTFLPILRLFIPAANSCKGPQDGDVPTGMGRECHPPFPTSRNHKFMCCDYCLLACLLVSFEYLTMNGSTIPAITFPFNKKTFRAFPLKKYFFVCVFFPKLKHFKSRLSLHSCILYCWGPLQIIQFSYFVLAQSKFQCHELMLDCLFLKESPINEAVITDVERDWFWFPCFDFILYTVSSVPSFLSQFIIPHFINIQPNDMLGETLGNSKCRLMLRSHVQGGQPAPRAALVGLVFPGLLRRESSFQVKGMKS